jgi:hypothetical protein
MENNLTNVFCYEIDGMKLLFIQQCSYSLNILSMLSFKLFRISKEYNFSKMVKYLIIELNCTFG